MKIKPGTLVKIKQGVEVQAHKFPNRDLNGTDVIADLELDEIDVEHNDIFLYLSQWGEYEAHTNLLPIPMHKVLFGDQLVWLICNTADLVILPTRKMT